MDWLNLSFLGDIGSTALVVLFVLAILRGALVPRSAVRDIRADRDARLAEFQRTYDQQVKLTETWQEAFRTSDRARQDQVQAFNSVIASLNAGQAVLNSVNTEGGEQSDEEA